MNKEGRLKESIRILPLPPMMVE